MGRAHSANPDVRTTGADDSLEESAYTGNEAATVQRTAAVAIRSRRVAIIMIAVRSIGFG